MVLKIQTPSEKPHFITAKQKLWRFHDPKAQAQYQNFIKDYCPDVTPSYVDDAWNYLKEYLLSGIDKVCGKAKGD